MKIFNTFRCAMFLFAACSGCLVACSPKHDWREVRGANAPFTVLLPAKPASLTQSINLDGQKVMMTMTAADVDGVTFAVGTATLPDAEKAVLGLASMKTALVKNIAGSIQQEKSSDDKMARTASIDIEAEGPPSPRSQGQPVRLFARFVARDKQIYQVVMVGRANAVTTETVDTFFTSFKLH